MLPVLICYVIICDYILCSHSRSIFIYLLLYLFIVIFKNNLTIMYVYILRWCPATLISHHFPPTNQNQQFFFVWTNSIAVWAQFNNVWLSIFLYLDPIWFLLLNWIFYKWKDFVQDLFTFCSIILQLKSDTRQTKHFWNPFDQPHYVVTCDVLLGSVRTHHSNINQLFFWPAVCARIMLGQGMCF